MNGILHFFLLLQKIMNKFNDKINLEEIDFVQEMYNKMIEIQINKNKELL